jgi:hypothetical protein
MKRIATAAIAVCLLSATAALADPPPHKNVNNGNHSNGGQPHFTPQIHNVPGGPQNFQHNTPQALQRNVQGGPQIYQGNQGGPAFQRNQGGPAFQRYQGGPALQRYQGGPQNFHPAFGAPGFQPGGPRPHYSPQFFPHVFNPGARFYWRGGYWGGPAGWYYHNWFYGQFLPFGWFGPQWWINNYWYYDLPVPPYGYEWVRNGPDVLLININTGFVAEVVPGIFY